MTSNRRTFLKSTGIAGIGLAAATRLMAASLE